jgi:ABC-2 type transport system permease protein
MNYALYTKELKRNRKNTAIWTAIVLGFTLLIQSIYPSFAEMGENMASLMSSMPEEFARAFGMDENTWNSINGFYSTYYGIYITLLMGIFTASTGATILGKEERDGTAEFLLTQPLSRGAVAGTKLAVLGSLFLLIYTIQTVVAILGMNLFGGNFDWAPFIAMHVHGFFLVAFFTAVGVLMGSFLSVKVNFMGPVVGLIFGSYFLNAISQAAEGVEKLGYISPYHYLSLMLDQGELEINGPACAGFAIAAIILVSISYYRYLKRDILG